MSKGKLNKMNKKGDKIISVYWFVILFIVAGAVAYMAYLFYGAPYNARVVEERILTNQIADCLSEGGYLKEGILGNENFKENFLKECNLNFNVEDVYGWKEQEQYYVSVGFYEFDANMPDGFGNELFNITKGNVNLKIAEDLKNLEKKREVDRIVIHYTESPTLRSAEQEFRSIESKSIHYLVDKDGRVVKGEKDENEKADHAGCGIGRPDCSESPDNCCVRGVNERSMGIELVNLGDMCGDETNKRLCNFGNDETCKQICQDIGNGIEIQGQIWEKYPDEQVNALSDLVAGIVLRYNIPVDREHIIGHDEVDPGRKVDPGPAFPWTEFIEQVKQKAKGGVYVSPGLARSFYVLDKTGKQYTVQISAIVGKKEKNEA